MLSILDVDRRIALLSKIGICLIKDLSNPILVQRAQLPSIVIIVYFKGPSVPVEPILGQIFFMIII